MPRKSHLYSSRVTWVGNTGAGTQSYAGYARDYCVEIAAKPVLAGSADPAFRGDANLHNPEDLFLSAIAACHMLTYLALCAGRGVVVSAYEDHAEGLLSVESDGGGRFERILLRPGVTITRAENADLAMQLHQAAHALCFIGNSCSTPIQHEARVRIA